MDGQTIFAILVGAALACFSLVMVGYSFFRDRDTKSVTTDNGFLSGDDSIGVDAILDSIDTLELEYQLGNIPEEQYLQQMRAYRLQAAVEVKGLLDRGEAPPELVLEQEVLKARSSVGESWRSCPRCDAPLPLAVDIDNGNATCPHCNAPLSNWAAREGGAVSSSSNPRQAQGQ